MDETQRKMPPNRKGAFDAVDNLETLQVSQLVDRAKFQPLTTVSTETTSQAQAEVTPVETSTPQQHHDDLSKRAIIDRILLEERLREQFSADHVIRTTLKQAEEKTEIHRQVTDSDDYWAMTTPEDLSSDIRSNDKDPSYWDWPTKTKQEEKHDMIQAILEQERIRQLLSVDHIVMKMRQQAAALQQKQEDSLRPQNDSYWAWDGKAEDDAPVDKEEVIRQILAEEKLRQQFSAETLEKKLIQEHKEDMLSRADPKNDDYWAGF